MGTKYKTSYQSKKHWASYVESKGIKGIRKCFLTKQSDSFIKHNARCLGNGQAYGSSFVPQSKHDKWGRVWRD